MCSHFIMIPKDELYRIIAEIQKNVQSEPHENVLASSPNAFPEAEVPVIVPNGKQLEVDVMKFGYERAWAKPPILFNTRADTAMRPPINGKPNMWDDSLRHRRCIVPSYGFYEPHKTNKHPSPKTGKPIKDQYYFHLPNSDKVMMAGVYEKGHFSIMTTNPNQWIEDIHDRMPVILLPDEIDIWLHGDYEEYTSLFDRNNVELVSKYAS